MISASKALQIEYVKLINFNWFRSYPRPSQPPYYATIDLSRAPRQAIRPAISHPTDAQLESGNTAPNYSSIGAEYATLDPPEVEGASTNIRERYEFAMKTDDQTGAQESMDYNHEVPITSVSEDYSSLQH